MGLGQSFVCSFMILMILNYLLVSINGQVLKEGYYSMVCPRAESIVQETMRHSFRQHRSIAPGLLKLFYSDCFVQGCDASVLISGPNTEKTAGANVNLRGFEVIDEIKRKLEHVCPGVVSCADILALAARDAVVLTNGPNWNVRLGRRDGRVSLAANVDGSLPSPSASVTDMLTRFATLGLGLTTEDFVALIGGGHTIGTTACAFISNRSAINPLSCPVNGDGSNRVALDRGSQFRFDTSIFKNILNSHGVLDTDRGLLTNPNTSPFLREFLSRDRFNTVFVRAMIKMSEIGVKTSVNGEIRKTCSAVN